jgi:hypothetical protein
MAIIGVAILGCSGRQLDVAEMTPLCPDRYLIVLVAAYSCNQTNSLPSTDIRCKGRFNQASSGNVGNRFSEEFMLKTYI